MKSARARATKDSHFHIFEEDKQLIPLSFIKEKFRALSSSQLTMENSEKVIQTIDTLEKIESVAILSVLFK